MLIIEELKNIYRDGDFILLIKDKNIKVPTKLSLEEEIDRFISTAHEVVNNIKYGRQFNNYIIIPREWKKYHEKLRSLNALMKNKVYLKYNMVNDELEIQDNIEIRYKN